MAATATYSASMRTRKTSSSGNAKSAVACQEYYDDSYNYVGIVHFSGMALSGKVITGNSYAVHSVDENGEEVSVHWFENKWRRTTCVARGVFASSIKALLKKTGWTQKTIRVPVWVKFCAGSGSGMCAVYTGSYQQVRWHTNMVTGEYVGYPD